MSEQQDEQKNKIAMSRRGFLKGSGVAMGAALLGSTGLVGCGGNSGTSNGTDGGSSSNPSYKVVVADILYIGGGNGALTGVWEAIKNNRKVTILDKGPFRAGGATGMNWDVEYVWYPASSGSMNWYPYENEDPTLEVPGFVTNKQMVLNALESDPNVSDPQFYVNSPGGECFPRRNADGTCKYIDNYPYPYSVKQVEGGFPRHIQDELIKSPLVTVYDRTMVTNILLNKGQCVGVTAFNLVTGEFTVYRANAVVLAAGGNCWFNGWNTVAAHSMNSPDNTSDVEMAVYRNGGKCGDAEFAAYDIMSIAPSGISYSFNAGLGGDGGNWKYFVDANGNYFLKTGNYDTARFELDRVYFQTMVAEYMAANPGALGPNGGIFLDTLDPANIALMRKAYSRNIELWKDNFGIDVTTTRPEVCFEMYEHGGTPVVDVNMMTDFPGLFCSRGAGVFGEGGGTCQYLNQRFGSYALRSALSYAKTATTPASVDFAPAVSEFARLNEIRTRNASGGLRPHVIRQRIQKACGACMSPLRTTAALTAAQTELARIRQEDLPNQVCSDKSKIYNTEWKMAIENYNMIDLAEMSVNATLARTESRGFYRPEYPSEDNTNLYCMLVAQQVNGQMTLTKNTLPTISWSSIDSTYGQKAASASKVSSR